MKALETVRTWYPRALTSIDTVNRLLDTIEKHLGLRPDQLMHADSMCCDDVNAIQYPPRAYEIASQFSLLWCRKRSFDQSDQREGY